MRNVIHSSFLLLLPYFLISTYSATPEIDEQLFRDLLLQTVDYYNGGLDGLHGMGVYRDDWVGLMRVDKLNETWGQYGGDTDINDIAQTRAIFINTEAYYAASDDVQRAKYKRIVQYGADYLIDKGWDEVYGGFYWNFMVNGTTPPVSDDTMLGFDASQQKQAYGQWHAIFALAQAYPVTQDIRHLDYVIRQYNIVKVKFADPVFRGGWMCDMNRDMSQTVDYRSSQEPVHGFEALLCLHDTLSIVVQSDKNSPYYQNLLTEVDDLILSTGNFFVNNFVHYDNRSNERAYIYMYYSTDWNHLENTTYFDGTDQMTVWVTPGHSIESCWLLSRAVERGFNSSWLITVEYLRNFYLNSSAILMSNATLWWDHTDEYGAPLGGLTTQWWNWYETVRAFLHMNIIRGCDFCGDYYTQIWPVMAKNLLDTKNGGCWFGIDPITLQPQDNKLDKAENWKVGYHEVMFYSEVLRLNQILNSNSSSAKHSTTFYVVVGVCSGVVGVLLLLLVLYLCKKQKRTEEDGYQHI